MTAPEDVPTQARGSCSGCQNRQTFGSRWLKKAAVLVLGTSCFFPPPARAQAKEVRRVLIFYEMGLSSPGVELVDQGIRAALQDSPYQIELFREYLETTLFPAPTTQQEFRQWYVHKYQNLKPDLIIAAGPSALKFLVDSHERYFGGIPIVFAANFEGQGDRPQLDGQFTGVWERLEAGRTLEAALLLQPATKHVVVVGGTTSLDRYYEASVRRDLDRYTSRLDITYLTDLTMPNLLEKLKHLPELTVVLMIDVAEDAGGTKFVGSTQATPMVVNASNAPVFSLSDVDVGHGEIGGDVTSFAKEGQIAGDIALRILNGGKVQDIPIVNGANVYMFDWRALKRWHLKESRLPADYVVLNKPPNIWETYERYTVACIFVVILQGLIIASLLWQRARRKKIEAELRESEKRFRHVANSAPVMIWVSGTNKKCMYCNRTWLEMTGRTLEQELGNGWTEGVHPEDLQKCWDTYSHAFDRRETFQMEYRLRRHDGEYRWLFDLGVPRFNADGSFAGYIGSCMDVSERKAAEEALSSVGRKLIEAHEEERTWIARELHDDINQRLSLLSVTLDSLTKGFPDPKVTLRFEETREQLRSLSHDIQVLSHRLHSSKLDYLGLTAACRGFCRELSERLGVTVEFVAGDIPKNLSHAVSLCFFRVLQEALQNAVKYSGVRVFRASLNITSRDLFLTVHDSGCGFDLDDEMGRHGLGLTSMKERMKLVAGVLSIESKPGEGTTVHARAPLKMIEEIEDGTIYRARSASA